MSFGIKPTQLREARSRLGWSRERLSGVAGVGLSTIQKFEDSDAIPRASIFAALCAALENEGIQIPGSESESTDVQPPRHDSEGQARMRKPTARRSKLASILLVRLLDLVRNDDRDLNLRQLAVLLICQFTDQPQTVRGLAKQLALLKPAVTRAVDRLEQEGLVTREDDPADRRSVLITITAAGKSYSIAFAGM